MTRIMGEDWALGIEGLGAQMRSEVQSTVWGLDCRNLSVVSGVLGPESGVRVCPESGV